MHLTHGAKPTFSGKYFNSIQYEVNPETYLIDYNEIEKMINEHKPRLFIAGASAYPREIDFKRLGEIIKKYNNKVLKDIVTYNSTYNDLEITKEYEKHRCYFMVDLAHIAGLVAAHLHMSPFPYADVVTSTTHKTLRGTRGGIILTNDEELAKKIDKSVFPAIQGGPLEHIIAAKAVGFLEALKPEFKEYQLQVVKNAKVLAQTLIDNGIKLLTGGTDNHLMLLDLRGSGITGVELEQKLANIGIITNKNAIPFDTEKKTITSGLRIGTPAVTTRGMKEEEMVKIGNIISDVIEGKDEEVLKNQVKDLCTKFPIYKD